MYLPWDESINEVAPLDFDYGDEILDLEQSNIEIKNNVVQ